MIILHADFFASIYKNEGEKIIPPEHVTGNHIYSNAYRVSLALGFPLEDARQRARAASAEFKSTGLVSQQY